MRNKKLVSFTLSLKTVEQLNTYAKENAVNKSALINNLIIKELQEKSKK